MSMDSIAQTVAELTPHPWPVRDLTTARVAFICALMGRFDRMGEHLDALPPAAITDLMYALDVMHPNVRLRVEKVRPLAEYDPPVRHKSIHVPCGRCGHEERVHGHAPGHVTACILCTGGFCQPKVLSASGQAGEAS